MSHPHRKGLWTENGHPAKPIPAPGSFACLSLAQRLPVLPVPVFPVFPVLPGLLSLLLLLVVIGPVFSLPASGSVETIDEDFTLAWGKHHHTSFDMAADSQVSAYMSMEGNLTVDFLLLDQANYERYLAQVNKEANASGYSQLDGRLNIVAVSRTWAIPDNRTYHVVVDNTDVPDDGAGSNATVSGYLTLNIDRPYAKPIEPGPEPEAEKVDMDLTLIIAAVILVTVLILAIGFKPER